MTLLAFSQGLDYVIQQLVQFANSLRWLGYVRMPVKGGLAASSHLASGMPTPGAQTLWHIEALSDVAVSFEMLHHHMNTLTCPIEICQVLWGLGTLIDTECISHHTRNAQSQSTFRNTLKAEIPGVARCALVLSHYYYNPNPNSVVSIARRHSTLVDPKVIMAPNANKKKAGTKARCQPQRSNTQATCWRPSANDTMSKIGFYSVKDMTRDGLDVSTSFASVFDKAPAMFCNGSSPTKDVMSISNGFVMPSSLFIAPPVSSTVGSSATSSSAVSVKRTLPPLLQFMKRQRTEGIVAEGGDVVMEDGGDVSIPAIDGDCDVVMQDGASVAATTLSSGAATHSLHNQLHLRDFGSQGEFSPASADVVVGENPKTLHQPLTWADWKGNTEPALPTPLENPYMGVKDYDMWSNQCEN
ncbi:hypothetical protein BS47DRAFT_1370045, partial [Hydnum rufescens UP504]